MNEDILFAYQQQDGDFIQWLVASPRLADQAAKALLTLNSLDRSSEQADLVLCRDASLLLHMVAREGGFEDVAAVFSLLYDQFSRAVLPFSGEEA